MCPTTVHDFQWMVAATRVAHKWQMRGDFPASMWLITELKRSLCTAEAVTSHIVYWHRFARCMLWVVRTSSDRTCVVDTLHQVKDVLEMLPYSALSAYEQRTVTHLYVDTCLMLATRDQGSSLVTRKGYVVSAQQETMRRVPVQEGPWGGLGPSERASLAHCENTLALMELASATALSSCGNVAAALPHLTTACLHNQRALAIVQHDESEGAASVVRLRRCYTLETRVTLMSQLLMARPGFSAWCAMYSTFLAAEQAYAAAEVPLGVANVNATVARCYRDLFTASQQ